MYDKYNDNDKPMNGQVSSTSEIMLLAIPAKLTAEHKAQIKARGFDLAWAEANCMSCDEAKDTVVLGYKAK